LLDDAVTIPAACIQGSFDAWTGASFADRLTAIAAPTLVLATDDPVLPPALLREVVVSKIPGARMAVLPGPGHYLQVERPPEAGALLQAFFAGLR
jgi:pimeloyl-ACP methyl ester carboxylesterase